MKAFVLVFTFFLTNFCYASLRDVYTYDLLGLSITKPSNWFFLTQQEVRDNSGHAVIRDKTITAYQDKSPPKPLVAITKYQEPYEKLNVSFSVIFHEIDPALNVTDFQLLQKIISTLREKGDKFSLLEGPSKVKVAGQNAVFAKVRYLVKTHDGKTFIQIARYWIVLKNHKFIQLQASSPSTGADSLDNQFDQILKSVKLKL